MKNTSLFLITTICIFITNFSAYSVDWLNYTLPPCNQNSSNPWQGPFEFKICGYQISQFECNDSCCYTLIYYDRWSGVNNREYEINLVGVFVDPSPNRCDTCLNSVRLFSEAYHKILVFESAIEEDFKDKVVGNGLNPEIGDAVIYVYNTAKCLQSSTLEECDNQN